MEDMQPDECTPEVSWVVRWLPKVPSIEAAEKNATEIVRRYQDDAIALARRQRSAGFQTKLYRLEQTEVDF